MNWEWMAAPRAYPVKAVAIGYYSASWQPGWFGARKQPHAPAGRLGRKRAGSALCRFRAALLPLLLLAEVGFSAAEAAAPTLGPAASRPSDRFDALILEYSQRARLNPSYVKAVIAAESEFSPTALSPRGARGLMQLMPATAEEMGVPRESLEDPAANIKAGTAYLNHLFQTARRHYGLEAARLHDAPPWVQRRVLAAYNAGPRALFRDEWPLETRCYVRKIMRAYRTEAAGIQSAPGGLPTPGPRALVAAMEPPGARVN